MSDLAMTCSFTPGARRRRRFSFFIVEVPAKINAIFFAIVA
jgi:hypothetical protein